MSDVAIRLHLKLSEAALMQHRALAAAQMRVLARGLLYDARLLEDAGYDGGATGAYLVAFSQVTAQLTVLREKVAEIALLRLAVGAMNGIPVEEMVEAGAVNE